MIEDFLAVLDRAGLAPAADELRDALWLAEHIAVDDPPRSATPAEAVEEVAGNDTDTAPDPGARAPTATGGDQAGAEGDLHVVSRSGGRGDRPRVRGTVVHPARPRRPTGQVELARAMRPFGRRVPSRSGFLVDEAETVVRIVEEGIWSPVLRPDSERWLTLSIAVDGAAAAAVWRPRVERFRGFAERLGLFRLVRVEDVDDWSPPPHRHAVLVVTDGVGDAWRDGRRHALLHRWSTTAPVAVCHVLAPSTWAGTGVQALPGEVRVTVPGAPNATWTARLRDGRDPAAPPPVPIPVVRFEPHWMASWSRVVAGTAGWTNVALLDAPRPEPAGESPRSPREVVERFRLGVSAPAFHLACLLSAAWLTLPVMRLVRDLMLPEADDAHLTEVFLGGVLRRSGPARLSVPPDLVRYDFLPGVREHLNDFLHRDDLIAVVRETSGFIAARYGFRVDIGAMLADPANPPRAREGDAPDSPAATAAFVLARLGGRYRATREGRPADAGTGVGTGPAAGPGDTSDMAGRLLANRYEVGGTLGHTGMSELHKGRDVRLGRDVAIKVLRADLARDPQYQELFRREAQNSATLNHPAIVSVYDTGETQTEYGPLPYIVMEFVDGRTLRDIVKTRGPLTGKLAMEVMADIAAALDFTHRHGIVHQNVKPGNIEVSRSGVVKLSNFGIAHSMHETRRPTPGGTVVMGTAQYLAPEQARGETVDARTDVYASGCVLFELLTGEPPFTGDSSVAVAYQHVREDPKPPSALNPKVTPALDAIVLKAMAKNPANRYQSAAELRADLVRVLSGQRPSAPAVMTAGESAEEPGPPHVDGGGRHQADPRQDRRAADEPDDRTGRRWLRWFRRDGP